LTTSFNDQPKIFLDKLGMFVRYWTRLTSSLIHVHLSSPF